MCVYTQHISLVKKKSVSSKANISEMFYVKKVLIGAVFTEKMNWQ